MKHLSYTIAALALTLTVNNLATAQCQSSGHGYRPTTRVLTAYPRPHLGHLQHQHAIYPQQHHYVPQAPCTTAHCDRTYRPNMSGSGFLTSLPVQQPVQQPIPQQPVQQQPIPQQPVQPVSLQQPQAQPSVQAQQQPPVQPQAQPPVQPQAQPSGKELTFSSRFLKLKNESKLKITVFLLYRDFHPQKGWFWAPASPDQSAKSVQLVLEPGQVVDLTDANGKRIDTSRIRIWASTARGNWTEFQQKDLWLVEPLENTPQRQYVAEEMGTFEFVFPGADAQAPQTAQQQGPLTKPADSAQ